MKSKPNRDKATAPKLGLGWCKNCDSAEVGHGGKCPTCGVRDGGDGGRNEIQIL